MSKNRTPSAYRRRRVWTDEAKAAQSLNRRRGISMTVKVIVLEAQTAGGLEYLVNSWGDGHEEWERYEIVSIGYQAIGRRHSALILYRVAARSR